MVPWDWWGTLASWDLLDIQVALDGRVLWVRQVIGVSGRGGLKENAVPSDHPVLMDILDHLELERLGREDLKDLGDLLDTTAHVENGVNRVNAGNVVRKARREKRVLACLTFIQIRMVP